MFFSVMICLLAQDAEDIDIFQRFGFGPACVRTGQDVTLNIKLFAKKLTHSCLPPTCVRLLAVGELEAALEFLECVVEGNHQFFLQYAALLPRPLVPIVVPTLYRVNPVVERSVVELHPGTLGAPGFVSITTLYEQPAGSRPCFRMAHLMASVSTHISPSSSLPKPYSMSKSQRPTRSRV